LTLLLLAFPRRILAQESKQFITVVNPVRISRYTENPKESLEAQYQVVKEFDLPATWLLTYDALVYEPFNDVLAAMDENQEFGIFLEVTPAFAQAAGVEYSQSEFWHHANAVFLSGYLQEDRKKLIDTVFEVYKQKFGGYPKSVGAWWIDSYSLAYLHEQYGVLANLGVSDQFATDNYKIWGSYWSTPYYPTRNHAAIPAGSNDVKIGVVTTQWAPRDPLNGYYSSLYSTQDYLVTDVKLDTDYFEKLVRLYAARGENEFGQVVVGLEADLGAGTYSGEYQNQLAVITDLVSGGEFAVVTMEQFAQWYLVNFEVTPPHVIRAEGVIWYQSPAYRIGLIYDKNGNKTKVIDLRAYLQNFQEPYFVSPNRSKTLAIQIPAIIDSINNERDVWELEGINPDSFEFLEDGFVVTGERINIPKIVKNHPLVSVAVQTGKIKVTLNDRWAFDSEGLKMRGFTAEAIHLLKSPKALLKLLIGQGWNKVKKIDYLVPAGEVEALMKLSVMPRGSVLVWDGECLQCEWHTSNRHPAFAGIKKYVAKLSGKKIIKNKTVFEAESHQTVGPAFKKTGARYIYLVKFEDYMEKLPFSPGDLGVRKIYENANVEIWEAEK